MCKLLPKQEQLYHPQSDGLIERFNRTLQKCWLFHCLTHPVINLKLLPKACLAYNTSVQPTTGFTPFFLMYGRQAKLPVDIMYGDPESDVTTSTEYASKLKSTLQNSYEIVRTKMQAELKREKEFYDEKVHGKPFEVDDLVWLHSPERGSLGSFTVLGKVLTELSRSYRTPLTESSSFRGARGQLYTLIDWNNISNLFQPPLRNKQLLALSLHNSVLQG